MSNHSTAKPTGKTLPMRVGMSFEEAMNCLAELANEIADGPDTSELTGNSGCFLQRGSTGHFAMIALCEMVNYGELRYEPKAR